MKSFQIIALLLLAFAGSLLAGDIPVITDWEEDPYHFPQDDIPVITDWEEEPYYFPEPTNGIKKEPFLAPAPKKTFRAPAPKRVELTTDKRKNVELKEDESAIGRLILTLRDAIEMKNEEVRTVEDSDAEADFQAVVNEGAAQKREEEEEAVKHEMALRGAWDDFKASVKNAGKKIKNAFGKREEQSQELEESELDLEAQKKEEEEEAMKHEMALRGAWDDFKASVKSAGKKIKNAFGKKEEQGEEVEAEREMVEEEEKKEEEEGEEKKEEEEGEDKKEEEEGEEEEEKNSAIDKREEKKDAATLMRSIEEALKEDSELQSRVMGELKERIAEAKFQVRQALKKRKMAEKREKETKREEKERKEEKRKEEERKEEERKAMRVGTRGKWDDFKQELRKMKFKLKERMGKRLNTNLEEIKRKQASLEAIKRDHSDLKSIQSALEHLKQDAIEAGMEDDPEIIELIKETEELAHQLGTRNEKK